MEINEEYFKSFRNARKVMKLWIITYNFSSRNKTNKQNNLLTLTVSYEKSSLIRRKKTLQDKQLKKHTHKTKQWDI